MKQLEDGLSSSRAKCKNLHFAQPVCAEILVSLVHPFRYASLRDRKIFVVVDPLKTSPVPAASVTICILCQEVYSKRREHGRHRSQTDLSVAPVEKSLRLPPISIKELRTPI